MTDIYDPEFVEKLFDEMADTYDTVNYFSSFGFSERWRRHLVRKTGLKSGMVVCDLMCGMGDCWAAVASHLSDKGRVLALDLSHGMLKGAEKRTARFPKVKFEILKQDVLANTLGDECADCVICGFGIKTFSDEQKEILAAEIKRILKPRGTFSLVEVSVPAGWMFEKAYMFYLKKAVPAIGRVFLGNPASYRMLGVYTEKFRDCQVTRDIFARHGLQVTYDKYFYGCATGVSGMKV